MLVVHKLLEEVYIPPEETDRIEENTLKRVLQKYLMKGNQLGLCVAVKNITYKDNIVLRESAEVLVELVLELLFLELKEGEYFEGIVTEITPKAIKVQFMGIVEGKIKQQHMHPNTYYDTNNSRWMLLLNSQTAFFWNVGQKVAVKIANYWEIAKNGAELCDIVQLRANEMGLGPQQWWA